MGTRSELRREAVFVALTLLGMVTGLVTGWLDGPPLLVWTGYGVAYVFGGWYGLKGAIETLRHRAWPNRVRVTPLTPISPGPWLGEISTEMTGGIRLPSVRGIVHQQSVSCRLSLAACSRSSVLVLYHLCPTGAYNTPE